VLEVKLVIINPIPFIPLQYSYFQTSPKGNSFHKKKALKGNCNLENATTQTQG
jgi:hypothetical protein